MGAKAGAGAPGAAPARRLLVTSGVLFGIGAAGAFDEIVFHQLLHWHHFYDPGGPDAALVSDGVLHAGTWTATVVGLALRAVAGRRGPVVRSTWWATVLLGAGGFQLWDGVVHHELLGLHQVRYGVDSTGYDVAWNAAGVLLLLAGALLLRRSRARTGPRTSARTGARADPGP